MTGKTKIVKLSATFCLLFLSAGPALAEDAPNDKTLAGYLYKDFFSPYFAKGTEVVWHQCPLLYILSALLLAYLFKRRGWKR